MPDIDLMGATYPDVPAVDLPKSGGGMARFYDPGEIKYASSATSGGSALNTEGIPFGEVASTSTSTAFTATVAGITELKDGTVVMLKNGVVTSASGFTININGLGAKPVYSSMATGNDITPTAPTRETTIFNINYTLLLVYSTDLVAGGAWINYRGYNANDNTIGYQLRTNSSGLPMSDKVYRYRICFTSADGTKWVPATTSTSTNATSARTVNQRPINPFGKIIYYSYTTAIDAGSRLGTGYQWIQYALVLGYSFNVAGNETVTAWKPCYLKCAPQTDGSAIMDSTTPIVQALPSTEDGKIYIFLGIAYDTTHMELCHVHPVYYYKGGAIRLWTNQPTELPAVTSSDNGKVLGVENGAWAVTEPSGGGGGKLLWYTDSGFTNAWVDQAMTETVIDHYGSLRSAWDAIVGATSVQLYRYVNANEGVLYSVVNFNFDNVEEEIGLCFTTNRYSWSDSNWRTVYLT